MKDLIYIPNLSELQVCLIYYGKIGKRELKIAVVFRLTKSQLYLVYRTLVTVEIFL